MSTSTLRNTKAEWPISLEELKARRDELAKEEKRASTIYTVLLFVFLFANFPLFFMLEDRDQISLWSGSIWIILFSAVLGASLVIMLKIGRKRLAAFGLHCPSCGDELTQRALALAIAKGRCSHCETILVADHPKLSA